MCLAYTDVRYSLLFDFLRHSPDPTFLIPTLEHVGLVDGTDLFSSDANFFGARLEPGRHADVLACLDVVTLQLSLRGIITELLLTHTDLLYLTFKLFHVPPVRCPPALILVIQPPAHQTVVLGNATMFVEAGCHLFGIVSHVQWFRYILQFVSFGGVIPTYYCRFGRYSAYLIFACAHIGYIIEQEFGYSHSH